jgi:hypothetical protein
VDGADCEEEEEQVVSRQCGSCTLLQRREGERKRGRRRERTHTFACFDLTASLQSRLTHLSYYLRPFRAAGRIVAPHRILVTRYPSISTRRLRSDDGTRVLRLEASEVLRGVSLTVDRLNEGNVDRFSSAA